MRSIPKLRFALVLVLALGLAGVAGAAPLNWSGTSWTDLGDNPPGIIQGGGVATVNGSGGIGGHLNTLRLAASRGNLRGDFTTLVTDPVSGPGNSIAAIQFLQIEGGTGTFGNISGALQNTALGLSPNALPVNGLVKLCLVDVACTNFIQVPLVQHTVNTGTAAVGVGGLGFAGAGAIRISLEAAPWTIKTATVLDEITTTGKANQTVIPVTYKGFAHGPASLTTSTAQPSGVVQLVTPTQVTTNLAFGSSALIGSGVTFRLHFIPEPGLLLLIGSGVAGLALLGRRRLRK
jgi:hypothetical protein